MASLKELRQLGGKINQEYDLMAFEFRRYQLKSGLNCLSGCGKCCTNPQIETSPLEMLPMALDFFDRGMAKEILNKLDSNPAICISYFTSDETGQKGFCSSYAHRPSLCRMFGAAGYASKGGGVALSVCQLIKKEWPELVKEAESASERPPLMAAWSSRVRLLDPTLGQNFYPINQALKIMLEKILVIAAYDDDGGGHDPHPIMPKAS